MPFYSNISRWARIIWVVSTLGTWLHSTSNWCELPVTICVYDACLIQRNRWKQKNIINNLKKKLSFQCIVKNSAPLHFHPIRFLLCEVWGMCVCACVTNRNSIPLIFDAVLHLGWFLSICYVCRLRKVDRFDEYISPDKMRCTQPNTRKCLNESPAHRNENKKQNKNKKRQKEFFGLIFNAQ